MVQAKTEMKERARALRRAGRTYDEIVAELGVSKSSVSLWVRDLPKPRRRPPSEDAVRRRSEVVRRRREIERQQTKLAAANEIGPLTSRELFLIGVGLYWAEGAKSKPHRLDERVVFVNSDPEMIRVYLLWLDLLAIPRERVRFALNIHESADIAGAERFWAQHVGVDVADLQKTSLKRHNPKTNRVVTGEHRGCLRVIVNGGADLYRRIEGWWYGIVVEAGRTPK